MMSPKKKKTPLLSSSRSDWHVFQRRCQPTPTSIYIKCYTASVPTEANHLYIYIYFKGDLYIYVFFKGGGHTRDYIAATDIGRGACKRTTATLRGGGAFTSTKKQATPELNNRLVQHEYQHGCACRIDETVKSWGLVGVGATSPNTC